MEQLSVQICFYFVNFETRFRTKKRGAGDWTLSNNMATSYLVATICIIAHHSKCEILPEGIWRQVNQIIY